mmetsp:Transcript_13/g.20  ORF Transcript_13/g.20 Transcript_13/m.20 type:complete len:124 (+) Transcript_13:63-434(+)|eukprot:CAMPEP_0197301002 /NCGR_PEP_ID=MMETSP0890-20130614/49706_1 /TAXON_ID=44058 ORGANISM="Aureoumbra lagunensis, Strain CCMP1510" /NCGR_SAMPLE_ID=MMETSP0890 /ASSEMBLY_ACC=CAM_ASM_000533 /LENGTH=123 /DNA_ID=CAMNT_0042780151 /DNA_START=34 /DNA_END=405 /DNA_ORIENTATION=+
MTNKLTDAIIALAEATKGQPIDEELKSTIEKLVWNNELDEDDNVPNWLIDLLTAMQTKQLTDWIAYPTDGYSFSNVFDLIGELDTVLPLDYEHREESIALTLEALSVAATIWLESNQYQVKSL